MYWFTFISVFFLGIIQGFIFDKRSNIKCNVRNINENVVKLYGKKFPWLETIDGDGEDENYENNRKDDEGVIKWDEKNSMQSLIGEKFICSEFPETDLVELTGQQVNLIAKAWYTHVLSELFDDTKQIDNLEKMGKVKKSGVSCLFHNINKFETTYHKNDRYKYYVWIPEKVNSKKESEILACFVLNKRDDNITLFSLLINPMWTSKNIPLKFLKKSLCSLKINNETIDINDFCEDEKNERIILEWLF
tara:strand:- start:2717 stop:3460 length:744 start_codon:yes stop_codon:yes gene_type:complete